MAKIEIIQRKNNYKYPEKANAIIDSWADCTRYQLIELIEKESSSGVIWYSGKFKDKFTGYEVNALEIMEGEFVQ